MNFNLLSMYYFMTLIILQECILQRYCVTLSQVKASNSILITITSCCIAILPEFYKLTKSSTKRLKMESISGDCSSSNLLYKSNIKHIYIYIITQHSSIEVVIYYLLKMVISTGEVIAQVTNSDITFLEY